MATSAENYLAVCTRVVLAGLEQPESQQDPHSYHHAKPGPARDVNRRSDNTPGEQESISNHLEKGLFRFPQQKALYSLSGPPGSTSF